jgi:hypothetical protein
MYSDDDYERYDRYERKSDKKSDRRRQDSDDDDGDSEIINIRPFDFNTMSPFKGTPNEDGIKIIIIGKAGCFAPGTKVLMYDGTIKCIEDVKVGEQVMGDDNTPRTVQRLFHDTDEMFEIVPKRGPSYTVNRLHDLVLVASKYNNIPTGKQEIISVEEYLKKSKTWKKSFKLFKSSGIEWTHKEVDLDPYFLGLWLGDGTSSKPEITNIDEEILNFCEEYASEINMNFKKAKTKKYSYSFITDNPYKGCNHIIEALKKYNLFKNKHIPFEYKITSREARLKLLAGIIDTDGYLDFKGYDIIQKSEKLMDDIIFVARSLGFTANKKKCKKSCMYKGEKKEGTYYRCIIYGKGVEEIPCKVSRKQIKENNSRNKNNLVSGFTVVPKGVGEYYGFELDGNRLFLLDTFDVVKNSGKSSLIKDIIASKAHLIPVAQVYSGTEDSNHAFSSMIPDVCVFNKLDLKGLEQFKLRQKIAKKYLKKPFALQIIDDCTDDPKILKKPIIQDYYKNGRHWNMLHILTLQYCLDIPPAIRNNYDYAFIFKENIISTREKLHKYFGACIQKFSDFNNLLDTITGDYTALVIKNSATATTPEECLFWYKANPDALPKNWKFGSATAWEFQQDRRDPNAVESLI